MAYDGFEHLLTRIEGHSLVVTINRPEVRNALAPQTLAELSRVASEAAADPGVRAVIFTGGGEKAFASGADIRALRERTTLDNLVSAPQESFQVIAELPKPTIAAVNGYALGGGCELAMACDIRIAADTARFGLPEVGLGIMPGAGGTQRLARLVGLGKAKELIFTGAIIEAEEALRIGLVNRVVPAGELLAAALAMAEQIASRAPISIRLAKAALNLGANVDIRSGLAFECLAQAILFGTQDKLEGTAAFLEKRAPRFQGR